MAEMVSFPILQEAVLASQRIPFKELVQKMDAECLPRKTSWGFNRDLRDCSKAEIPVAANGYRNSVIMGKERFHLRAPNDVLERLAPRNYR
jgi:hypothetical protein